MHDVLLVLPPVGPLDLYAVPEEKLASDRLFWKRKLTRIPQGLLSIATWLNQNGVSVKIFDCRFHINSLEHDLTEEIKQTRLYVAISVYTMHIEFALKLNALIKQVNPNLPVVWGGVHPTLYPEQTAKESSIDFVVQGEGENPLLQLAQNLQKHKNSDVLNSLGKSFDVNLLESPNYDALEIKEYLKKRRYNPDGEVVGIEYNGSRGCSFLCAFCVNNLLPQMHVWRGRNPEKIGADLQLAKERFGVEYVFLEEEFPFVNRDRSLRLAAEMKKLDVTWYGNIRADLVCRDEPLLKTLYGSGWRETSVGAESGSNRMLNYLHKGITVEQTVKAAEILSRLGIYALYSFMTNLPTETQAEQMDTYKLMRQLKRIHPNSEFIGPQSYRPYPKTEWYEKEKALGKFVEPTSLGEWVSSGYANYYAK
jgi:radical SAM superfamily enzyme YgiQ (UPF0313 family)